MKRIIGFLLAFFCICLLTGCEQTAKTEEEMVALAERSSHFDGRERPELIVLGKAETEEGVLLALADAADETVSQPFTAIYRTAERGYRLSWITEMRRSSNGDCFEEIWADGIAFVISDERCASIQVVYENGEIVTTEVTSIPFFWYEEEALKDFDGDGESNAITTFLDENEKELS